MIKLILHLLEKISYRTKFGLSLADLLKFKYYKTHPYKCLCGGKITSSSPYLDGWIIYCKQCGQIYDED